MIWGYPHFRKPPYPLSSYLASYLASSLSVRPSVCLYIISAYVNIQYICVIYTIKHRCDTSNETKKWCELEIIGTLMAWPTISVRCPKNSPKQSSKVYSTGFPGTIATGGVFLAVVSSGCSSAVPCLLPVLQCKASESHGIPWNPNQW